MTLVLSGLTKRACTVLVCVLSPSKSAVVNFGNPIFIVVGVFAIKAGYHVVPLGNCKFVWLHIIIKISIAQVRGRHTLYSLVVPVPTALEFGFPVTVPVVVETLNARDILVIGALKSERPVIGVDKVGPRTCSFRCSTDRSTPVSKFPIHYP